MPNEMIGTDFELLERKRLKMPNETRMLMAEEVYAIEEFYVKLRGEEVKFELAGLIHALRETQRLAGELVASLLAQSGLAYHDGHEMRVREPYWPHWNAIEQQAKALRAVLSKEKSK